jgi:hypothetical protein
LKSGIIIEFLINYVSFKIGLPANDFSQPKKNHNEWFGVPLGHSETSMDTKDEFAKVFLGRSIPVSVL